MLRGHSLTLRENLIKKTINFSTNYSTVSTKIYCTLNIEEKFKSVYFFPLFFF